MIHPFRTTQNADTLYNHMLNDHNVTYPEIEIEWMEDAHRSLHSKPNNYIPWDERYPEGVLP